MLYIGIDPGQSGGMSVIMPSGEVRSFAFTDQTDKDIADDLREILTWDQFCFVMLENVHSMPKQGVSSSFKFGRNFGLILGLLNAFQTPFELVSPQKWQKALNCLTKGDKNVSKRKAQMLFPKNKWTHATADSALLAEYCRITKK